MTSKSTFSGAGVEEVSVEARGDMVNTRMHSVNTSWTLWALRDLGNGRRSHVPHLGFEVDEARAKDLLALLRVVCCVTYTASAAVVQRKRRGHSPNQTKPQQPTTANATSATAHVSHHSLRERAERCISLSRTTMKMIVHPRHTNVGATRISLSTSHRTCGHGVAATQTKREDARWGWCARRTNGCRTRSQWVRGTRRARRRRIPASGVLPQHPACTRGGRQSSTPTSARWPSPESSRPRDWWSGSPA